MVRCLLHWHVPGQYMHWHVLLGHKEGARSAHEEPWLVGLQMPSRCLENNTENITVLSPDLSHTADQPNLWGATRSLVAYRRVDCWVQVLTIVSWSWSLSAQRGRFYMMARLQDIMVHNVGFLLVCDLVEAVGWCRVRTTTLSTLCASAPSSIPRHQSCIPRLLFGCHASSSVAPQPATASLEPSRNWQRNEPACWACTLGHPRRDLGNSSQEGQIHRHHHLSTQH